MRYKNIYVLALLLLIGITGCAGSDVREQESSKGEAVQVPLESTGEEVNQKTDQFTFGYAYETNSDDMYTYIYDQEYIEVPFKLGVQAATGHDIGFLVFINGVLQKYSLKGEEGIPEATMQLFDMDEIGEKKYTFLIKPNVGEKGDKLGIYICGIVYPSFQPKSEKNPSYQYFGSLSQLVPEQVRFVHTVPDNGISYAESKDGKSLSEEVVNAIKMFSTKSIEESLENTLYIELYQKSRDEAVMKGKDGKVKLKLKLYGGVEGEYCTTIFINNKPVLVEGKNMIRSALQVNKMSEYEFTLDISDYGQINTVYAVSVPSDDAYLEYRPCVKSNSKLLINK